VELVALGAAVGACCESCTRYDAIAARKTGLADAEVLRAIDVAEAVRREGGIAVADVGRYVMGFERERSQWSALPSGRSRALVFIGASAGCNAARLLRRYVASARRLDVWVEELRAALEIADVVKRHAAEFVRHGAEQALEEGAPATPPGSAFPSAGGDCAEAGGDAPPNRQERVWRWRVEPGMEDAFEDLLGWLLSGQRDAIVEKATSAPALRAPQCCRAA